MNEGGDGRPPKRDYFVAAMAMLAMAGGQLSTGSPETPWQWGFLILSTLAVGLAAVSDSSKKLWKWMRAKTKDYLPKVVPVLVALVLLGITGRLIAVIGPPLVGAARVQLFGCDQPVLLRLLTAPETLPIARELTTAFEAQTAPANFQCPTTTFFVYEADPAETREAIARGWGTEQLGDLGPRPDLWLPGSTDFEPLAAGDRLSEVESVPVASSPIVLAVPEELIGADPRDFTWAQALQKWPVARPEPSGSLVGRLATLAVYESMSIGDAGRAHDVERSFELALDAGDYPLDGLLCRHTRPQPPRGTVIVAEQDYERFNRGLPLGGHCTGARSPGARMVAVRPAPVRTIVHPAVRLQWTDASEDQNRHARAFMQWLGGAQGRAALRDAGLRPGGATEPRPDADDKRLLGLHEQATRPGRILLALDTSGSMKEYINGGGATRFSVAAQGVSRIADLMGRQDELGLWVFPGVGRQRELLPLGPPGRPGLDGSALQGIALDGQTPLYRTIADGVRAVPPGGDAVRALVVLTDGVDTDGPAAASQMKGAAEKSGVRVFVIAVGEASCASEALAQVTQSTGGACEETDFGGLDAALSRVFTQLWKGA